MKWLAALVLPMAVDVAACTMPAWLRDSGPNVPPRELLTGLDGSESQHHSMLAHDAGSTDAS